MIRLASLCVMTFALSTVVSAQQPESLSTPDIWLPAVVSVAGTFVPYTLGIAVATLDGPGYALMGASLIASGIVIGPSLGSFMLGDERRGTLGMGIRFVGAAGLSAGVIVSLRAGWSEDLQMARAGGVVALISAPVLIYGLVYNLATLRASASEATMNVGLQLDAHSGTPMPTLRLRF
jgi:hypothetical protein